MSEEHIIVIDPDGTVQITVNGVAGKACKDATAQIEKALGMVTKDTPTSDMYKKEQVKVQR